MSYVFISYSRKDKKYVNKLKREIIHQGFELWIDDRIECGAQWHKTIEEKLDKCSACIVIMTPDSKDSDMVSKEIARAIRKKKRIFPLLLHGDEPWLLVETTQFFDVRDGCLPSNKFFESLAKVVSKKVENKKILVKSMVEADSDTIYNQRRVKIIEALNKLKDNNTKPEDKIFYLLVGECEIEYTPHGKSKYANTFKGNIYYDTESPFKVMMPSGKDKLLRDRVKRNRLVTMGWSTPKFHSKSLSFQTAKKYINMLPLPISLPEMSTKILSLTFRWDQDKSLLDIANLLIETNKLLSIGPSELSVVIWER